MLSMDITVVPFMVKTNNYTTDCWLDNYLVRHLLSTVQRTFQLCFNSYELVKILAVFISHADWHICSMFVS